MKNQIKFFGKACTIVSEAEQKDMSNTLYLYAETINGIVYLKLSRVDGIICDPCCGIGTIFDYIRTQYDVPKDNFY